MTRNKPILAFIAGSSFPALLIPFIVLGTAMMLRPEQGFPPQFLLWFMPPIMGIWNILLLKNIARLPGKGGVLTYWLAGGTLGLLFTIVGVSTGAPGRLYGLTGNLAPLIMPIGIVAHGFIWGVMVRWTNKQMGLL